MVEQKDSNLIQLEDDIPVYPDQDDPMIQKIVTDKMEFLEMEGQLDERPPIRGDYYRHQKMFMRYLLSTDSILLMASLGSGKSCSFIALSEHIKAHPTVYKHVYILEKGSTTKQDMRRQIVCSCSPESRYEIPSLKGAKTESTRKGNITRILKEWYSVITYRKFASQIIDANLTDEEIKKQYSGCLFIVDEAHNLRNDGITREDELARIYETIHRIFHVVDRKKIIVATATPMINDVKEIAKMMNLILPSDHQMPLDWDYKKVTLDQMEPYFRGRVSYIRNLDTGVVPTYMGDYIPFLYDMKIPDPTWIAPQPDIDEEGNLIQPPTPMVIKSVPSQVKVQRLAMGEVQNAVYKQVKVLREEEGAEKGSFHLNERHISSLVFPDGSFRGNFSKVGEPAAEREGLGKYVYSDSTDSYNMTPEFREMASDLNKLYKHSCKFATIIDIEKKEPGCGFAYFAFIIGGGIISFAMCLEAQGFVRYNESQSAFISTEPGSTSFCASGVGKRRIKPGMNTKDRNGKPILRYAMLTSDTSDPKMASMLEMMNSEENANGEYIKLFIGSPVARDGINVFNVRRGYMVNGDWHPSGIAQALGRFIRATSHTYLISLIREELKRMGEDPVQAAIEVKIYKLVAVDSDGASIDMIIYQIAEDKDLYIRRIMRMLKQCSVDCQIHYNRNVRTAATSAARIAEAALRPVRPERVVLTTAATGTLAPPAALPGGVRAPSSLLMPGQLIGPGGIPIAAAPALPAPALPAPALPYSFGSSALPAPALPAPALPYSFGGPVLPASSLPGPGPSYSFAGLAPIAEVKKFDVASLPLLRRTVEDKYDKDGSAECDYDVCEYKCVTATRKPTAKEIDYSTYDILYSDEVVEAVTEDIIQYLRERGTITFPELKELFVDTGFYRQKFIYIAIDRMLTNKRQLFDRFGYSSYVQTDGFNIYTQREFPTDMLTMNRERNQELAIYSEQLIGILSIPFETLVAELQTESQTDITSKIDQIVDPSRGEGLINLNLLLEKLSISSRVSLFEKAINKLTSTDQQASKTDIAIFTRFQTYFYETYDPIEDINLSARLMSTKGQIPGRKGKVKAEFKGAFIPPSGPDGRRPPPPLGPDGKPLEIVYIHTLYDSEVGWTSYAVASKSRQGGDKIRIFKPSEKKWRDVNAYEKPVYQFIIQTIKDQRFERYDRYNLYGTIGADKKFRIVDKTRETVSKKQDTRDKRRGLVCATFDVNKLINILIRDNVPFPQEVAALQIPPMNRDQIIEYLIRRGYENDRSVYAAIPDDQLQRILRWYAFKATKPYICKLIQEQFAISDRLAVV